jgi:hypothetical protein
MAEGPALHIVIEPAHLERRKVEAIMDEVIREAEDDDDDHEFVDWLERLKQRLLTP